MAAKGVLLIGLPRSSADELEDAAIARGLSVRRTDSLGEGLGEIRQGDWLATLLSMDDPSMDLLLAERVAAQPSAGLIVVLTATPTLQLAVDAAKLGAIDLLALPVSREAADELVQKLPAGGARTPIPDAEGDEEALVGGSHQLLKVFREIGNVARSDATVLVVGESGTGKERIARVLHEASTRREGPFIAINCAAIPENLLESELFGHERGAFTGAVARKIGRFERANGGTLFLDEIGDMSLVLQAKILRALQEREVERLGSDETIRVDVRVVAATHRDLASMIRTKEFREDLFYRLAVVRLQLPPLRERPGDVRALSLHFLAAFAKRYERPLRFVSEAALSRLEAHSWPGNVRELRNVLERAVLVSTGDTLDAAAIDLDVPHRVDEPGEPFHGYSAQLPLAEVERLHIARVLGEVDGHLGRAAEVLGVHRNTLSRKVAEMGIAVKR